MNPLRPALPTRPGVVLGLAVALAVAAAGCAFKTPRDEFCAGFAEGYKAIRNNESVPACPAIPSEPESNLFRAGSRAGVRAAGGR